jgi:hypothetical protein
VLALVVELTAERRHSSTDGRSEIETLIRPQTPNGGYAGGPFTLEEDTTLADLLDVIVARGEYPLNTPLELGTLDGEPIALTVRAVAK